MALKKVTTTTNSSASHNIEFVSTGRKAYTAPEIKESFVDDEGNVIHILANGNTQSDASYMAAWGRPKGKINWKAKGINPDKRHLFFK